jgi:hypothetical protein
MPDRAAIHARAWYRIVVTRDLVTDGVIEFARKIGFQKVASQH